MVLLLMNEFKQKLIQFFYGNVWRLVRACFFLLLSIAFLLLGWFGWFSYGNDQASWFARSGAIVAICAGTSEAIMAAYGIGDIFKGISTKSVVDFTIEHYRLIKIVQFLAATMVLIGTMVWAYGDLIYTTWK